MKADIKKRYETNLDLLNLIVNFCVENNLKAIDVTEVCVVVIFRIPINDKLWIVLKDKLKSDERFYQQPKRYDYDEFYEPEIRVKKDRPGNTLARVSVGYCWEKGMGIIGNASIMELNILTGRGFAGNKEYKQIIVDLLKNIYTDAENLNYE